MSRCIHHFGPQARLVSALIYQLLVADIVLVAIRSWETPTFPLTRGARSSSGRMSECWYPIIAGTRVPSLSASAQCNFTARLALVSVTLDMQCTSLRHNAPTPNQTRPALRLNNSRVLNSFLFNSGLTVIKISVVTAIAPLQPLQRHVYFLNTAAWLSGQDQFRVLFHAVNLVDFIT